MSRATELLEQVAPAPWHYFSDGKIYGNDGDAMADCYGNAAHLVGPSHRAEVIVYAVNRLPDYEAAVEALDELLNALDKKSLWTAEFQKAHAAVRRLREGEAVNVR